MMPSPRMPTASAAWATRRAQSRNSARPSPLPCCERSIARRPSTDGQSVDAQVRQLTKAGCKKVFREVATGAKTDRAQLRRLLDQLDDGDVRTVTRLDRLARSTRDLLNTLGTITDRNAGFRSFGDIWPDRPGAGEGARSEEGVQAEAHSAPAS
jgi:hypothetical protein